MDIYRIGIVCLAIGVPASAVAAEQASSSSSAAVGQATPCSTAPLGHFSDSSTDTAYLEQRGIAYALKRDYTNALAYLQRACELAPSDPDYAYTVGRVQVLSGHPDQALPFFDRTLVLQPNHLQALLARAQLRLKDHARAKADLDSVDRIVDSTDDVRLDVGMLYDAIGELNAAIHQYDLWLESHVEDPRRAVGLDARCRAWAEADQNLDQALKDCDDALRQQSDSSNTAGGGGFIRPRLHDNPDILASRGLVWLRRGEFNRALKDYDEAVAGRPKVAEYRFARGLAKLRAGRQADGQADIAAAVAMQKDVADRFATWGLKP
jgi:tetratricopeptide (TPR) repeat protein